MSSGIFSKLSLGGGRTGQEHLVSKQKVLNDEYKSLEEFDQQETLGTWERCTLWGAGPRARLGPPCGGRMCLLSNARNAIAVRGTNRALRSSRRGRSWRPL